GQAADRVPGGQQLGDEPPADVAGGAGDQDASHQAGPGPAAGRANPKVAPSPGLLSAQIRPCWASTSVRAMYSPRPFPAGPVPSPAGPSREKRRKRRSPSAGRKPGPRAVTATATGSPAGENLRAFDTRLPRTRQVAASSPEAGGTPGSTVTVMTGAVAGPVN